MAQLGQSDEDHREQLLAVPVEVTQHVEVAEDFVLEQLGLVEHEDRVHAFVL